MDQPQPPQPIVEGQKVWICARVRKNWGDRVIVRILTRDGSAQKWTQLSVPPYSVVAAGEIMADDILVPAIAW